MATERLNDVWLIGATWWQGCRELLLRGNCFCKAMAVSQAFIFHFMCYSLLHFVVYHLLCWAFLYFTLCTLFDLEPVKWLQCRSEVSVKGERDTARAIIFWKDWRRWSWEMEGNSIVKNCNSLDENEREMWQYWKKCWSQEYTYYGGGYEYGNERC